MEYDNLPPDQLVGLLHDKTHRYAAIVALVGGITATELREVTVSEPARQALLAGLKHHHNQVRWWCIQLMDHLADERYIEPLLEAAFTDSLPKNRHHALHALTCEACKPDRCALDTDLSEVLARVVRTDSDWSVRLFALKEFTKISSEQATGQLIETLAGPDQAVVRALAVAEDASSQLQIALACTHKLDTWRGQLAYKLLNAANNLIQAAVRLLTTSDDLSAVQHRLRQSQQQVMEAATTLDRR